MVELYIVRTIPLFPLLAPHCPSSPIPLSPGPSPEGCILARALEPWYASFSALITCAWSFIDCMLIFLGIFLGIIVLSTVSLWNDRGFSWKSSSWAIIDGQERSTNRYIDMQ